MPVKILLADKSITIQKVVEMLFSGKDYEVICVSDGETGLVVPPGDPAALASAIRRLADDPDLRGQLGKGAKQRIAAGFNVGTTVKDMLRLLNGIGARDETSLAEAQRTRRF